MALSQIFLLLVSIVALSYAVGSEVGVVSGSIKIPGTWKERNPKDVNPELTTGEGPYSYTEGSTLYQSETGKYWWVDSNDRFFPGSDTNAPLGPGVPIDPTTYDPSTASCAGDACDVSLSATPTPTTDSLGKAAGTTAPITDYQFFENFGSHLISGLQWALLVYGGTQLVFGTLLDQDQALVDALSEAGAAGVLAANLAAGISEPWAAQELGWFQYGTWVGIGVGATYFITQYEEETTRVVEFSCRPWQPPTGGENCEECNNKGVPCSEYQCRALGQGCELINKGTGEESCVWVNRNDVNPPVMNPWENALLNEDYEYTPDNTISPPDRGVLIDYATGEERIQVGDNSMGCIPAFTPLRFGITTDEPAKCKIDKFNKEGYEEMDLFLSDGLLRYNHSFGLTLPGASNLEGEGIELQNDGQFEAYVRCEDTNENSNVANFLFKYCVETGPDTTPPLIVATSIPNNAPISFNRTSLDFEVYVNEPAECRWDKVDRDYENMEPNMNCDTSVNQANAQGLYTCATTLDGLKSRTENEFYFRCRDQPEAEETSRNTNIESFEYNLQGTQPLVIDSVSPDDETVKDSTDSVKVTFEVETSAGHNQGEATCYWSDTGNEGDYVEFFNTRSHTHNHDFFLPEAEYIYHIRCTDLGGNTDNREITFEVESDNEAPKVVRAYHEETFLRVNTNEEARCVYDVVDCSYSFDDGIEMTSNDDLGHFVDWDVKSNLYIKCRDEFGNEPNPDQCSIVARTTNF